MLQRNEIFCAYLCSYILLKKDLQIPGVLKYDHPTAEIIPVEPDQGNACAGKADFSIYLSFPSRQFDNMRKCIDNEAVIYCGNFHFYLHYNHSPTKGTGYRQPHW